MLNGELPRPRVSVLLPVRDAAPWLPEAIDSLRSQTLEDIEIVAVDDGSTDDTPDLLRAWAATDLRVRIVTRPAEGIVAALEHARRLARAPLLARMDADDVAHPARLERQLSRLDGDRSLVACGCRTEYFPADRIGDGARRYERWINGLVGPSEIEHDLFVECPIAHPTLVVRADAVDEVGGWRDAGWPEDYDLLLRLWRAGGRFAKVPEILLRWRERPDRLSRTDPAYSAEAFRRCKIHHLRRTLLDGRDVVVWGAGPTGKRFARALQRAGIRVVAFVDLDPRKIGKRIHGAEVVSPGEIDRLRGAFCVAAVGQRGAREEIRGALRSAGWTEMEEFVAVA